MIRQNRMFVWLTVVILAVSAGLLILTIFGYGHVSLDVPADATVQVNGHGVTDKNLRLRSGTYHIAVESAHYYSTYDTVHVSPFKTTEFTPKKQPRSTSSIAYSAMGVSSVAGVVPPIYTAQWVGDDWVIEEVGPSTATVLVAHYQNGRWQKAYRTGDNGTTIELPTDVANLVAAKEGAIRAANQ